MEVQPSSFLRYLNGMIHFPACGCDVQELGIVRRRLELDDPWTMMMRMIADSLPVSGDRASRYMGTKTEAQTKFLSHV